MRHGQRVNTENCTSVWQQSPQQSELCVAVRSCDTSATQALEKKQLIAAGKLGKFGRPLEGSSVTASQ